MTACLRAEDRNWDVPNMKWGSLTLNHDAWWRRIT